METIKLDTNNINDIIRKNPYFTGCIINVARNKYYYSDGMMHRDDGPAYEGDNGDQIWFCNGLYHREDGPARITRYQHTYFTKDGMFFAYKSYYIHGKYLTEKEWEHRQRAGKLEKFLYNS